MNSMKKLIALVCILVLTACAPTVGTSKKTNTIVFCSSSFNYPRHQMILLGFQEGAKAAGVTAVMAGADEGSAQELMEMYKTAVTEHKAGGTVVLTGDDIYYQMMREWSDDGVKIAVPHYPHEQADTETFIHASVAGNNKKRGYLAADTLVALLREKGITSGAIGVFATGSSVPYLSNGYFCERMKEIAPEYTLADPMFMGLSLEANIVRAESVIANYPDLVAMYVDNSSVGGQAIVQAAEDAGREDLVLIACDETKENLDLLEQGKLDALMVSDLYQEGYQCAQNLAKLMAGEEVEWYTEIEEKVLTRESDLTYYKELWSRIR